MWMIFGASVSADLQRVKYYRIFKPEKRIILSYKLFEITIDQKI